MAIERYSRIPDRSPPPSRAAALFALILLASLLAIILLARDQLGNAASGCYGRLAPATPGTQEAMPNAEAPKPDFSLKRLEPSSSPIKEVQKPTESGKADNPKTH